MTNKLEDFIFTHRRVIIIITVLLTFLFVNNNLEEEYSGVMTKWVVYGLLALTGYIAFKFIGTSKPKEKTEPNIVYVEKEDKKEEPNDVFDVVEEGK